MPIASPAFGSPDLAHAGALVLAHYPATVPGRLPTLRERTPLYVRVAPGAVDLDPARAAQRNGVRGSLAETAEAAAVLAEVIGSGSASGSGPRRPLPLG